MEREIAIRRLEADRDAIAALFSNISEEQARWKPTPDEWSLLETMAHLYDEEREDFRKRLDIILHTPDALWPPIDPQGWVTERAYNDREIDLTLWDFLRERNQSLSWLRSLKNPDWSHPAPTPWNDAMTGEQMLHCWLAHDMLHLRQMVELHYKYIEQLAAPESVEYAGGW